MCVILLGLFPAMPVGAQIETFCPDLGHFGDECSLDEMGAAGIAGRILIGDVEMRVNAQPGTADDARVKVTGFCEAGTNRPGMKFEVVGNPIPSYNIVTQANSRDQDNPIAVLETKFDVDFTEAHTGSGENFVGSYLNGFMMDRPVFNGSEKGFHIFAPGAASTQRDNDVLDGVINNFFGNAEAQVLPATLIFDDPAASQATRMDWGFAGNPAPGFDPPGITGWTVVFDLAGEEPPCSDFEINQGINDAWFNAATAGQGFFIIMFPDTGIIFMAWFTYDTVLPPEDVIALLGAAEHRWLTAQGPFEGDTATLEVFLTEGGIFDMSEPAPTTGAPVGTITIVWHDCENATLTYDIDPPGVVGEIPITRIVPDNVAVCEALLGEG